MTQPFSSLRQEWLTGLVLAANAALVAWAWPRLPERLPLHWNWQGEVDRFGGRFEALILLPLILLLPTLLTLAFPGLAGTPKNAGVLRILRLGLALLSLSFTAQHAFELHPLRAVLISLGVFFVLLGNVLGKTQPNRWMGVRTHWTFLSRQAWHKSQRRGGAFLVSFGLLSALAALLTPEALLFPWLMPFAFLLLLLGGLGWITYQSYRDYHNDPQPEPVI
ncbi:DUF1648 domain-containing protein [Deinococcus oregonensis]|uniref:DUF1648 domain-containing protein n=1 Tax=Deinococcus oregonensis TaxID=1805970 RepID=A0ABV6B548_9DEIO